MRPLLLILTLLIGCASLFAGTDSVEVVAENLDIPWGLAFLPDGRLVFTERTGNIRILQNGNLKTVGKIAVASLGEGGLLGVAIDPNFRLNKHVYFYYTYEKNGIFNRISRFELNGKIEKETVILDSIPGASIHNGGRIKFGPDGFLYITTGDANNPPLAGNKNSLAGKILRIKKDGELPADNPFGNPVYALGLRNPQGLAWSAGVLYVSEHGPVRHDAIRRIEKGINYGWPKTCDETPSIRCYPRLTLAPSGMAEADGMLLVACLRGERLLRVDPLGRDDRDFLKSFGRLRDAVIHGGWLYFCTSNRDGRGTPRQNDDRILRIRTKDLP